MSNTTQVTNNAKKAWIEAAIEGDLNEMKKIESLNGIDVRGDDSFCPLSLPWTLQFVVINGHIEVVKYLVEKGVNIHAALRCAAHNDRIEIVEYLVENGADIHARNDKALRGAAVHGHIKVVKYLVEKGADIHAYIDKALRSAAEYGHIEVVKFLVEKGADIHAKNDKALRRAERLERIEIVKYLEEIKKNQGEMKTNSVISGATFVGTFKNESVFTGDIVFNKDTKVKIIDGKIVLNSFIK